MPKLPSKLLPLVFLAGATVLVVLTVTLSVVMDDSWTQVMAAAGIVAVVIAAAVMLGTAQGWANGTSMSLAALTTAVVGLGAVALFVVTLVGGSSNMGSGSGNPGTQVSNEGAALSQEVSNNQIQPPGYAHDVGSHPTVNQFLSMDDAAVLANVPGGTVLPNEVDPLREQLSAARQFALDHNTPEKAQDAGFFNTTNDVPFMGAHFINQQYLTDGVFDASKPEGLLFSKLGNGEGDWQLVGVWYLLLPGQGGATDTTPPEGFAGNLDLWHQHFGLCTRHGVISENNTFEGCKADGGNWVGDLRWMMHVWVYPESGADNSQGVFVYLNNDLFDKQQEVRAAP